MDAKELRIGNWVRIDSLTDGSTTEVEAYVFHIDEMIWTTKYKYSPIPLTEEWLIKFGFEKDEDNGVYWINSTVCIGRNNITYDYWEVWCDCSEGFICLNNNGFEHVHQLQNLYFALTNKELTIKP